jgi:hypothetical protein
VSYDYTVKVMATEPVRSRKRASESLQTKAFYVDCWVDNYQGYPVYQLTNEQRFAIRLRKEDARKIASKLFRSEFIDHRQIKEVKLVRFRREELYVDELDEVPIKRRAKRSRRSKRGST